LQGHDYSREGYYFLTICTQDRREWFGNIENGEMVLNEYGVIVGQQWEWLEKQYGYVQLDQFVVMPNHVHGVLSIIGNGRDRSLQKIKSVSELVGAFKTTSSKLIHHAGLLEFRWQKSFYDQIIRDDWSLNRIREYILNNPLTWADDVENRTGNSQV
jgi:REP element-mobilizing transposase RayT